ncbi:AIPR protein [Methylorubrum extorquens]
MIFIDDVFVSSREEVDEAFKARKRDAEVTVVFTQIKTSESWKKAEINTFESAILDFLSDTHEYPHSDYMTNCREVFNAVISQVGKIPDGKPSALLYFATTAREAMENEILGARAALEKSVRDSGFFNNVRATLLNRDSIFDLWRSSEGAVEATLQVLGSAAFPGAPGVKQGYVVTVKANNFINQILKDPNDRLRQRIFEENVRDVIGIEGEVNNEISVTLSDSLRQKRFGIMNNGVTIISPDVRLSGFDIFMRDFQIVNGCQRSNVLFEHRSSITDDATLMLKIIETSGPAVADDIVRSTNRQAKVEEDQFLATLDAVKAIERYFEARGADEERRLYFERRKNQFSGNEDAKAVRLFDVKELARCVGAMFLDKPDIASRYPNRLTGELRAQVFNRSHNEEVFNISAYTLYRVKILISNGRIDAKFSKLRWHIITAIKYYVCGEAIPQLSSPKIKSTCADIERFLSANEEENLEKIRSLCNTVVDIEGLNRDKIKGSSLTAEIREKALDF